MGRVKDNDKPAEATASEAKPADGEADGVEIVDAEIVEEEARADADAAVRANGGRTGGTAGAVDAEVVEPEVVEPELVEPEVVEPEAVEPEIVEPEVVEPEVVEPDADAAARPAMEKTTAAGPAPYRLSARPRSAVRSAIWLSVLAVLLLALVGVFVVPVLLFGSEPVLPTVIGILAAGAITFTFGVVVPRLLRPMLLTATDDGIAVRASGGALAAARWGSVHAVEVMTGLIPTRSGDEVATPVLVVWTRAGVRPLPQSRVDAALLEAIDDGGPDTDTGPQPAAAVPLGPFDAEPEGIIEGVRAHAPAGVPVRDRRID
jgi:hypothetical protein